MTDLPPEIHPPRTDAGAVLNWALRARPDFLAADVYLTSSPPDLEKRAQLMGKIIVSENATVDGGVKDPTGEEGTPGGGWFTKAGPADLEAFGRAALEEALAADAFLMGRRTYEFLASRWPARTGPLADRLNDIPKYVVSATLETPAWHNTTVLQGGDPGAQVAALSQRVEGEIIVPASFQLVRTLLEHHLVDELRVMVFPVILGTGESVLGQLTGSVSVRLLAQRTLGEQLAYTAYEVVRS